MGTWNGNITLRTTAVWLLTPLQEADKHIMSQLDLDHSERYMRMAYRSVLLVVFSL